MEDKMKSGIKCPYCEKTTRPIDLSEHIKSEHGQKVWTEWVDKILEKAAESKNFIGFEEDESKRY